MSLQKVIRIFASCLKLMLMKIEWEIKINQYAQGVIPLECLLSSFEGMKEDEQKAFINGILHLLLQSKPLAEDIKTSIENSGLKPTYTPCVLLAKGMDNANLYKIADLPSNEWKKVLVLFLHIFRIAYSRRYLQEKESRKDKWWYWDLSNEKNVERIKEMFVIN